MMFISGLAFFFGMLWAVGRIVHIDTLQSYAHIGSYAAAIMFVFVGMMHFIKPEKLEAMIPPILAPHARLVNYGSGLLELLLGLLLIFPATREPAAWGLILLLVIIFPANIYVAQRDSSFYNISRLFFQPVYIAWVWFFCLHLWQ